MHKPRLWVHAGRHKTGSSAIQQTLYTQLDHPDFHYLDCGRPNASLLINQRFRQRWTPPGKAAAEPSPATRAQAGARLAAAVADARAANVILSAESISLLEEAEFRDFLAFFSGRFDDIVLLAYFRPPKSDMESAFIERLRTGPADCAAAVTFKHRRRFAMFERLLGASRLRYYRYHPGNFPGGDVVAHFCQALGIVPGPGTGVRANRGLSLPAVRLLYSYRKLYPTAVPEDRQLLAGLSRVAGPPLRFHSGLFRRNFRDPLDSFSWLEARTACSFLEDIEADDALGIRGEEDLLALDDAAIAGFEGLTGAHCPADRAELARALRHYARSAAGN